jgi:TPR repeat protein
MTHRIARFASCLVAFFATALPLAAGRSAHADSAQLHWEYQCLKDPDAVCFDTTPSGADPLAPKPVAAPTASSVPAAEQGENAPPTAQAATSPASGKSATGPAPTAAPADMLGTIAGRLRAGKPTPADMKTLQARARQGNARALELLAWAELVGVGVPRDPVQAYFHYGMAAAAGLPTGRRDQAAIFTYDLTSEERQQILLIENGAMAAGRN